MSGFLFAFLATLVASFGARDQALLAQLTAVQGRRPLLLATALASALLTTAFAAWGASRLLPELAPDARATFAALALVVAGGEMMLAGPRKAAAEPTLSLFAALLVFLAHQITDAARFLVLALAVGTAAPVPAALGGFVGSAAALAFGWGSPRQAGPVLRVPRRIAGCVLLGLGIAITGRIIIG